MNQIMLKQLSVDDGENVWRMLQNIDSNENEFKNEVKGMSFENFKSWLIQQDNWSKGKELPEGYVEQTTYWLYDGELVVGYGKLRHRLTEYSRVNGGNIGYAISQDYRGLGYGKYLFSLLLKEAENLGIEEIIATVEKNNISSKKVIEYCGGRIVEENQEKWYFSF